MPKKTPEITLIPIDELLPYARNARKHSEKQISQIAASIKEFGFTNPVLLNKEKEIIAGHGRVLGGQRLGIKQVPCIYLDHLTKTQQKAYRLIDNQLTINSKWDDDLLKLEIDDLVFDKFDLNLLGFEEDDLARLMMNDDFENDLDDKEDKEGDKKYILEIEFPDEQAMKDEYNKLCSEGLIVRFK